MDAVTLRLTTRQWATIDSGMDNCAYLMRETALARGEVAEEDLPRLATLGLDSVPRRIREEGATQVPWLEPGQQWPPDDQEIEIRLSTGQWQFIIDELRRSAPEYDEIDDAESADLIRSALRSVSAQTGGHGPT